MAYHLKASRQAVLDAINSKNNLYDNPLTLEQVALGFAQPNNVLADGDTLLTVYALNHRGYNGTQNVTYNRNQFERYFKNITALIIGDPVQRLSDILPLLNAKYNMELAASDIVDVDVSGLGEDWTVPLVARTGNVMWTGKFNVRYAKTLPLLSGMITSRALGVIVAPLTDHSKPRAEYVAYPYDFTEAVSWLGSIAANASLTADQVEQLNTIANVKLSVEPVGDTLPAGHVSLYGAKVKSRGTTGLVARANENYLNVVIVTLAASSNYAGDLYLHFNPVG